MQFIFKLNADNKVLVNNANAFHNYVVNENVVSALVLLLGAELFNTMEKQNKVVYAIIEGDVVRMVPVRHGEGLVSVLTENKNDAAKPLDLTIENGDMCYSTRQEAHQALAEADVEKKLDEIREEIRLNAIAEIKAKAKKLMKEQEDMNAHYENELHKLQDILLKYLED